MDVMHTLWSYVGTGIIHSNLEDHALFKTFATYVTSVSKF
jgi:hypothetical protein